MPTSDDTEKYNNTEELKAKYEKLVEQLETENKSLKEKLKERDEKLKETNDKQVEQLETENKALKEQLTNFRKDSLKSVVRLDEPFPLLTPKRSRRSNEDSCKDHLEASAVNLEDFDLPSFDAIPAFRDLLEDDKSNVLELSSSLLSCTSKHDFTYGSEADVSFLTSNAVLDAVELVKRVTNKKCTFRKENGLFSNRPDNYVVYTDEYPLIIVEDKKPFQGNFSEHEYLNGQCLDYASLLRLKGLRTSIVIATTFDKSVIYCLKDDMTKECLLNMVERIESCFGDRSQDGTPPPAPNQKPTSATPPELQIESSSDAPRHMYFQDVDKREVVCTEEFQSHKLVVLLFYAILSSLAANQICKAEGVRKIPPLTKDYNGPAMKLTEKSYTWGHLENKVQTSRMKRKRNKSSTCTFYVITFLGNGDTSNAFYALDENGNDCVVKMYVNRYEGEEFLETADFEKKAKRATQEEANMYETLYPQMSVRRQKIYRHYCVVMPFFKPIPKTERKSALPEVKEKLLFFGKKGYKYRDDDICWRHVGRDSSNGVVLFDLGDLEPNVKKNEIERIVSCQMKHLTSRI